MHEGHRQRILKRLEENEISLESHELLEILLFGVIPRKNTNPIAHELLSTFGTLGGVLHASVDQLSKVNGVGKETASFLRTLGLVYDQLDDGNAPFPKKFNLASYSEFLTKSYGGGREEVLDVFCLDANERVKLNKRFTSMLPDSVKLDTGALSDFLVTSKCHGIVLAHNHPQESCRPSPEDERFTAQVALLCSMHNVLLYDHIIVGNDGVYSYFRTGRMEEIRKQYHYKKLIGGEGV